MKNFSIHGRTKVQKTKSIVAAGLAVLTLALLSGCGGGGGGSSSGSSTPQTEPFSGSITNTASPAGGGGFTVRFNTNGPETVSSSNGNWTLRILPADITGNDTIYALDTNGFVVGQTSVTNDASGQANIVVNVGPPSVPPLIKVK